MSTTPDYQLSRNAFGLLCFTGADGNTIEGIIPVRAFAITAPGEGIALAGPDGSELAWIARLTDLPDAPRQLIEEELASREFMPEIKRIRSVSSFATPSTWTVETDRGDTQFTLKGEDDIRRLNPPSTLMIADSHGIHYLIRDRRELDKTSRKFLDRFL